MENIKENKKEVPVTITYLDNSKSTVNVRVNSNQEVLTGIVDFSNNFTKIILALGIFGVFVSIINFWKKSLRNYE